MDAASVAAEFIWSSGLLIGAGITIAIVGLVLAAYLKVIEDV